MPCFVIKQYKTNFTNNKNIKNTVLMACFHSFSWLKQKKKCILHTHDNQTEKRDFTKKKTVKKVDKI